MKTSVEEKKRFAAASHAFNIANKKFRDIFPEVRSRAPPLFLAA